MALKITTNKYGSDVAFKITLSAQLPEGTDPKTLTPEKAKQICMEYLECMAGCNDGSEIMANATPELVEV